MKRTCFSAQTQKKRRLPWDSKFVPFDGQNFDFREIVELKAFIAKPKHQNLVSQLEEHVKYALSTKEWRLL